MPPNAPRHVSRQQLPLQNQLMFPFIGWMEKPAQPKTTPLPHSSLYPKQGKNLLSVQTRQLFHSVENTSLHSSREVSIYEFLFWLLFDHLSDSPDLIETPNCTVDLQVPASKPQLEPRGLISCINVTAIT